MAGYINTYATNKTTVVKLGDDLTRGIETLAINSYRRKTDLLREAVFDLIKKYADNGDETMILFLKRVKEQNGHRFAKTRN